MSISSARKARRNKGGENGFEEKRAVPQAPPARPEQDQGDLAWSSAPQRAPFVEEHQRPADRRRKGCDGGERLQPGERPGRGGQEQRGSFGQDRRGDCRAGQGGRGGRVLF